MNGNQEVPASKEVFSTAKQTVALQTRLILGGEALSASKTNLNKVNSEMLSGIKPETINKISVASTKERSDYWQGKGTFDQQLKSWCDSMVKYINNPEFTEEIASKFYDHYFGKNNSESNINIYIDEVISEYTQNETVNLDQLYQNLPRIKKLSHIFGENSSEIIEDLILARAKLTDPAKKQELIEQVNEEKTVDGSPTLRLNWLNPDEERRLKWLYETSNQTKIVTVEKSKPITSPKTELKKTSEPIDKKSQELTKKSVDSTVQKPKPEPIRVTPEQNLQAAQFFCHNLREKLKNGTMQRWDGSNFIFTDPESGISIKAQSKNAVDTAWTDSNTFTEWASKHNLPIVIWHQVDGGHYTLLLKGPEKQFDGKYKVLIYNPFRDQEEYEDVPINEDFDDFKKRELPKLHYNADLQRYDLLELGDNSYVEKDRVDQYLFSQWFKLPPQRNYQASEQAYQQLVSKTNPYNLSIAEDVELPWELKVGKGQRFQSNGYDCGPLSFYSSVLRYAALPGHENEKKQLVDSFADQFDVRILTRKELLGR